jgi:membrane protein required for colicin V production
LISGMLGYFLRHSALSVLVDRIIGLVFGTVRGAVVIAVFVMLGEFVELNRVEWWRRSSLLPYASELAGWIQNFAETGMRTVVDVKSTQSGA